ncbi:MAG TPA: bifunctional demethylmenaquinone methyltransferase/2-methoxy-6-polyprenyl-1,4-benzoquinol methylase UbiE [Pseudomonadales bacterium]|jgi:demethylmenaquinone methyltransferase/2-methoxy-6-polyprenyl-1,4-benzoquinol methylase|nr:bifunctional demethylmenaquinone methyltransferase/2-methoxy-6-polyprenyl-1,4-benzoquinol methylase UbiE [Gammaproteobacteria bacterium]MDP6027994.1 bifunctional demethylmenaquinone methyltransferase/2-methoxy-6-polyprenyl-1,4-benzoquinol methylase UbiE [Pseudomonadales bacterium]MDP6315805.1 bifunctional demethylmenaquinone methyltransferase/2-methoxy-6-polyprenyl-1,4-benzoquinol methylase UbiE [Pseudomonadales bacterium]MDP7315802.1 bifunctional demethylmenaquinone methyltransferase/2-metho|tara:strand:+ start:2441 stop:3202 length:762 start_codon:yes stop_codon:yes gene_type:complete
MKDHESTHFGFKKIPIREKAGKVAEVFHSVATKYDLMNDVMSLGSHRLMKQLTVEHTSARKGHKILDLAGGTGDLTARLSPIVGESGQVILCDINESMLSRGRDRLIDQGIINNVSYLQADAENLPFPDDYFNSITIAFGLRNITRKEKALDSMLRVLKPGGRLVILEFSKPQNDVVKSAYKKFSDFWPKIGKTLADDEDSYQYLVDSIEMHPDQETLKKMMLDSGFTKCEYHNLLNGITAIHTGRKAWIEKD